uniref:Bcl-2/adenovirus E1B 19 kDa-interacting protein 2-like protein n=1 Tax=Sphenodon punctatus TaxID=8508 RepID=A0A8D0L329_SPHPU
SIDDMELKEEWQDEEFPRLALDRAEGSMQSGDFPMYTPEGSVDLDVDELETPSESEQPEGSDAGHEFDWEDSWVPPLGTLGASDKRERLNQPWLCGSPFLLGHRFVGSSPIQNPVVQGYYGEGLNAVILFASCYLPDGSTPNYPYVMENLFRYIIGTLELMVAENYMLVCLNGATPRRRLPPFHWVKQCYRTINRRLRKNLKALIIVHPAWYVKALMALIRPFISSKFRRKVQFVGSLGELSQLIPLEKAHIPECVRQ